MEKKKYTAPIIEIIHLDNDISLQLQSIPPEGPCEETYLMQEHMMEDPFRNGVA